MTVSHASQHRPASSPSSGSMWRATLSGFSAYLSAANLAGYLAGAVLARSLAARVAAAPTLNGMMMLATVAFVACAYPLSFPWFFAWRVVSGAAGGVLMVLAATTVLPHVTPSRRGFAGGVIFMGVGAGIVASGTLVPLLLRQGLAQTWLGLGIVSLILTLIAWRGWPSETRPAATSHNQRRTHEIPGLRALYAEYGLNAVGLVPRAWRWSGHLFMQVVDLAYFSLLALRGRNVDTTVEAIVDRSRGIRGAALGVAVRAVAGLGYAESRIMRKAPALGVHVTCVRA